MDKQLESLFKEQSFRNDLSAFAHLPDAAYEMIRKELGKADAIHGLPDTRVQKIASEIGVSATAVASAYVFSVVLTPLFAKDAANPEEVIRSVEETLHEKRDRFDAFQRHILALPEFAWTASAMAERHRLITSGGKTIGSISVACDLRLNAVAIKEKREVDSERSFNITELLPVVLVSISFAHVDDGDDVTFQLTPGELEAFIRQLRDAQQQLHVATERVRIG